MKKAEKPAPDVNVKSFYRRQKQIRATLRIASELLRHKRLKTYTEALLRAGEEFIRADQKLSREFQTCQALHQEHFSGEVIDEWLSANEHYLSTRELLTVYKTIEDVNPEAFDVLQQICGQHREPFDSLRAKLNESRRKHLEGELVITDSDGNMIYRDDESVVLPFNHSPDYSAIVYKGIPYILNGVDRLVVRLCNENRGAVVTMEMIRTECNKDRRSFNTFKMKNIFSGRNRELLGTLIRRMGPGYIIDRR